MLPNSRRLFVPIIASMLILTGLFAVISVSAGQEISRSNVEVATPRYVEAATGSDNGNDCSTSGTPCATIQHAVDVANVGEEVRVAAGIYTGVQVYTPTGGITQTQVVYIDKSLTLRGGFTAGDWENPDPANNLTIVDAQGQGRPVTVLGPSWSQHVTLSGMTLTGGDYTGLGNPDGVSTIHCNGSGHDCGGGLYVRLSAIHLEDMVIENNVSSQETGEGGGIFLNNTGGGTIERTTVRNNASPTLGGGISIHDLYVPLTISESDFMSNTADYGGGIFIRNGIQSLLTIEDSSFTNNEATVGDGGALSIRLTQDGTIFVMDRVTMQDNQAAGWGKALYIDGAGGHVAHARLSNLLLTGNGLVNEQANNPSDAVIVVAPDSKSGVTVEMNHVTAVSNTVETFLYTKAYDGLDSWATTVTATNVLLADFVFGYAVEEAGGGITTMSDDHTLYYNVTNQTRIVSGDPTITTVEAVSGDPLLDLSFHLTAGSAAIDAGKATGVPVDLDGQFRPQGPAPDIGADEFYQLIAPTQLSLIGPGSVVANQEAHYLVEVQPLEVTFPLTYTWETNDQTPVIHVSTLLTDSVYFSWPALGQKTITVTVANAAGEVGESNSVEVIAAPALQITKTGPAEALTGETITYTLVVSNVGLTAATDLIITDTVPSGANNPVPLDNGVLVGGGSIVSWTMPSLAAQSDTELRFTVNANSNIVNDDYRVTASGGYSATGQQPILTVFGQPQLAISKSAPSKVAPGENVAYEITVSNAGSIAARNLVVSDTLPAGASYQSGGTLVGDVVQFELPKLAAGDEIVLSFSISATQTISNVDYLVRSDGGFEAIGTKPVVTFISGGTRYVSPGGSDGLNVCNDSSSPCKSIQHAVDVANVGEEVRVAAGIYTGVQVYTPTDGITQTQVVYIDKSLTLRGGFSVSDWENSDPANNLTIVDAQGQGRPVTVLGPWGQPVTLSGMTLTGGDYTGLGNPDGVSTIHCNGSGHDCGGGLYVRSSAIHLEDMVIENNVSSQETGEGGGIFLNHIGGGTIKRTIIRNNASPTLGGGISIHDLSVPLTISESDFISNTADYGGGIFIRNGIQSLLTIEDSSFTNNEATAGYGGALSIRLTQDGTIFVMDRVTLQDNRAADWGKALYISGAGGHVAHARLSNLLLTGNGLVDQQANNPSDAVIVIAPGSPAGVTVEMNHVTAVSNTVETFLYTKAYDGSGNWATTVTATNVLLADFVYGYAAEEAGSGITTMSDDHTLYYNVTNQTRVVSGTPVITTFNPVFGDPKLKTNFHLGLGSAAIDAGLTTSLDHDIDGEVRPTGDFPDIGADELVTNHIFLPVILK